VGVCLAAVGAALMVGKAMHTISSLVFLGVFVGAGIAVFKLDQWSKKFGD
jgi:hypothetical protein